MSADCPIEFFEFEDADSFIRLRIATRKVIIKRGNTDRVDWFDLVNRMIRDKRTDPAIKRLHKFAKTKGDTMRLDLRKGNGQNGKT